MLSFELTVTIAFIVFPTNLVPVAALAIVIAPSIVLFSTTAFTPEILIVVPTLLL